MRRISIIRVINRIGLDSKAKWHRNRRPIAVSNRISIFTKQHRFDDDVDVDVSKRLISSLLI